MPMLPERLRHEPVLFSWIFLFGVIVTVIIGGLGYLIYRLI